MALAAQQEQPPLYMSEAEYLAFEEESEIKHEFVNGEVYAMTGGSVRHGVITANAIGVLFSYLSGTDCHICSPDTRIKVKSRVAYRYPDVTVYCGEPEYVDGRIDTLGNPVVLFEVLSPSSMVTDRNEKLREYTQIETLQEYILISQREARVEQYLRQETGKWLYTNVEGLDASLELPSIEAVLSLSLLYQGIHFDES